MLFSFLVEVYERYPILQSETQILKAIYQFLITIDHYTCLIVESQISFVEYYHIR